MSPAKNILLVNPWIYDFTAYDFWMKPLGLLYVAALLDNHTKAKLHFIDCLDRRHPGLPPDLKSEEDGRGVFFKEEVPKPDVLKEVPRKYSRYGIPVRLFDEQLAKLPSLDLVLITCTMTYWYPGVQAVVDRIRRRFGSVPVMLGGVYASLAKAHAESFSGADIVLAGPGERMVLPRLRDVLGDTLCPPHRWESLEELPLPAFRLLRNRTCLPYLSSRGCPFRCAYCAGPLLCPEFEQMTPALAADQLEACYRMYRTGHIAFYDDALLVNKERHILPLLQQVARKRLPLVFHTPNGLHVREIDPVMARSLKRARFRSIFLSLEGWDETVREGSGGKVDAGDLERAVASLVAAGYETGDIRVYLMVGLPGQEAASVRESIRKVVAFGLRPALAYFSPVPGTRIWKNLVDKGILPADCDPLLHNKLTFPYIWGDFPADDFEKLKTLIPS